MQLEDWPIAMECTKAWMDHSPKNTHKNGTLLWDTLAHSRSTVMKTNNKTGRMNHHYGIH
jgi:hypothetical protein